MKDSNIDKIDIYKFMSGVIDELTKQTATDYYKGRVVVKILVCFDNYVKD